ncbi:hypothetical protein C2S52_008863 [Perilla frutescens var. hirtella]|nr:hypothetical protein C2S52_008863 [Perilla frutescens var. hirtella]
MGKSKTAKWFRSLLGSKKSPPPESSVAAPSSKKSKWALSKAADYYKFKNEDPLASPYADGIDANKHAIAAAAEVVRLTSGSGSGRNVPAYVSCDRRRVAAALKIQSAFRAYLARRALRALKGLVKLQALVRGHIVRKQSSDMLRRMQAMARIQARASAHRSKPNIKFSKYQPSGVVNHRNYYQWSDNVKHGGYITKQSRTSNSGSKESSHMSSNWLNQWMEQYSWNNRQASSHDMSRGDDERSDKILEIDTWKPRQTTRRSDRAFPAAQSFSALKETGQQEYLKTSSLSRLSAKLEKPNPSISSEEVSSPKEVDQVAVWTAENSPRVHSASSRPTSNLRGMFTPTRSECSRSLMGDYLSHPSYMANTESSRAKVRSQSAPKQRMQLDELGVSSTLAQNAWESDAISEKGDYRSRTYLHNVHLKRQGTISRGAPNGVSSTSSYGYRF